MAVHSAERTCLICRRRKLKAELCRFVRSADGQLIYDPAARASGRGFYLCCSAACIGSFVKKTQHKSLTRFHLRGFTPESIHLLCNSHLLEQ
ncbi:MAG: YlxR family protein [Deltaproteobacteria bacterium]|nr:YlxR family protein [Candidatus Anaeroferrophillus wilburensis]MBN2888919.1 YlxR family protein [Deltaproteobacteria bacterium]